MSANSSEKFDVLVVGSGHAGTEAALAAARMGAKTAVVTINPERSGWMPCNPAIGGIGKGHLVREIDALGGEMALAIDDTGIQFRRLNTRKGPAVRARRAQADMFEYSKRIFRALSNQPNLTIIRGEVAGIWSEGKEIRGVYLADGSTVPARAVVITTGTFLRGLLHFGMESRKGGRIDEPPSNSLSESLKSLGLSLFRLKTGTPPRLDKKTIDFSKFEPQPGDDPPLAFSFLNTDGPPAVKKAPQVQCYITYTNEITHQFIREGLDRSPLFTGKIEGVGPRYCPSIEDKVVRFPDRPRHQIFLEPCARDSDMIYPNGISTSLPPDVQEKFVRSIPGLENVKFIRYGYAVEYDAIDARELYPWLQHRNYSALFFAGQINGTSGYEEAAGQGILAGINAALFARGEEPLVIDRTQAYIGVMVDDLTTRGVTEPYRMFTSRAEYRLLLREDNADLRLTPIGREIGLVDDRRWRRFQERVEAIERAREELSNIYLGPESFDEAEILKLSAPPKQKSSLLQLLKRTDLDPSGLEKLLPTPLDPEAVEQLLIESRYSGYLNRQRREAKLFKESESIAIPEDFDYNSVPGLRTEIKEILSKARPLSIGQAARIPGVTPSSLQILTIALRMKEVDNKTSKNRGENNHGYAM